MRDPDVIQVVVMSLMALTVFMHVALTFAVASDAVALRFNGSQPAILPIPLWAFLVLITGVVGFALYWLMNRSTLATLQKHPAPTGNY